MSPGQARAPYERMLAVEGKLWLGREAQTFARAKRIEPPKRTARMRRELMQAPL